MSVIQRIKRRYACYNSNGGQTGAGLAEQRLDGRWDVRFSYGSPFAGHVCDDGREFSSVVDDPDRYMASYGAEPLAKL